MLFCTPAQLNAFPSNRLRTTVVESVEGMELNLNGESYEVASVGGLRYHLPKISDTRFAEVWLYSDSSWPAICALVNGVRHG